MLPPAFGLFQLSYAHPDPLGTRRFLYLYGGVTNHWNTLRNLAVRYAVDTGVTLWYPVYPSISEACITEGLAYLAEIYRRMLKRYDAAKIAISGVSMGGFYELELINYINHKKPGFAFYVYRL